MQKGTSWGLRIGIGDEAEGRGLRKVNGAHLIEVTVERRATRATKNQIESSSMNIVHTPK